MESDVCEITEKLQLAPNCQPKAKNNERILHLES